MKETKEAQQDGKRYVSDMEYFQKEGFNATESCHLAVDRMVRSIFPQELLDRITLENDIFREHAQKMFGTRVIKLLTQDQIDKVKRVAEFNDEIARIRRTFEEKPHAMQRQEKG